MTPALSLESILKRGLRELRRGTLIPVEVADVSHCGCTFEPGCWGTDGWHFRRYDVPALYERERYRFAAERTGWSAPDLRKAWAEWMDAEETAGRIDDRGVHELWKPYIGIVYAYETCSRYLAKYRASLEASEAGKRAEKVKSHDRKERR